MRTAENTGRRIINELSQQIILRFVYVLINPIRDGLPTGDLTRKMYFNSFIHTSKYFQVITLKL
jgi:hypothetical protein